MPYIYNPLDLESSKVFVESEVCFIFDSEQKFPSFSLRMKLMELFIQKKKREKKDMQFEESFYGFFRFTSDITKWLVTITRKICN